ncbi:MAG: hypothetical protein CMC82_00440 [Flavobacteriaceae bacterium]|nr:hypothetical protein [Flavobacteriaceae bacterium]
MAFLDNSGDIILDAVLTDLGRKRLAAGNFRISKFALGDEEINYSLFSPTDSRGSAFYDLQIMQTPLLEAFTSDQSLMKTRLLSFARNDILYMPILKLNNTYDACLPSAINSGFHLTADNKTFTRGATTGLTDLNTGFIRGQLDSAGHVKTTHVCVDQGIDSSDDGQHVGQTLDPSLLETAFLVRADHRLIRLQAFTREGNYQTLTHQFLDDDNIATYYIIQGQGNSAILGPRESGFRERDQINPDDDNLSDHTDQEVFAGPLGNVLRMTPRVTNSIQQSTSLFTELGGTGDSSLSFRGGTMGAHKFIDTTISVTGVTTGYSIDIPIRILKKD